MSKKTIAIDDWRSWNVGDEIKYHSIEHSLYTSVTDTSEYIGKVSKVFDDHVLVMITGTVLKSCNIICSAKKMVLWVDDSNIELFSK